MSSPSKVPNKLVLSETAAGVAGAAGAAIGTRGAGYKCSVDVKFRSPVATLPMKKIVHNHTSSAGIL